MIVASLVLLSLTAVWGLTFPLVQGSLAYASPPVFLLLRFLLAAIVFPLIVYPSAFRLRRELLLKGLWLGVLLWGGYTLQTFGLAHTTAARSGFLTGTLVPLTPLFSWLLFRTRIAPRLLIAVLLALTGTAVMSRPEAGGLNLGDILTLLCAVSFALQIIFVGRWAKPDNVTQLTWLQLGTVAVLSVFVFPLDAPRLIFSPFLLIALGVTALFASAFAIWAQLRFQPMVSATAAAVIYACEPIFAGFAAWWLLDLIPPTATLIGAGFIVCGMALASYSPKPKIP